MRRDRTGLGAETALRRKHGIATIGPEFFGFDWVEQYDLSVRVLMQHAEATADFDALVLPVAYLQRHVAELLLKWVIDVSCAVSSADRALRSPAGIVQLTPAAPTHDLVKLEALADLNLKACGFAGGIRPALRELLAQLQHLDQGEPSRLRYSTVRGDTKGSREDSFPSAYHLGLRSLHELYTKAFRETWGDPSDHYAKPRPLLDEVWALLDGKQEQLKREGTI